MSSVLRVLLVFEYGTLNGGERSMLAALEHLAGEPLEVFAAAPPSGPLAAALSRLGVEPVPLSLFDEAGRRLPRHVAVGRLHDVVRRIDPDLVHANSLSMGRVTGALAPETSVPCLAHLRDIIRLSGAAVADLNRNRVLFAVSNATRTFHCGQGLTAERVQVLYNGVDPEQFRPRPREGTLRRELGVSEEAFLTLSVGQIGLRKGLDVLADAAAMLAEPAKNVHYVMVGERHSSKAESFEYERSVRGRFASAGLSGRVHWLGGREDVPRLMNECDLLVHAARQEPLGRVLLEAAASGLPIVATDVGGTPEILTDGVSARLVPPCDADALARAIGELYDDIAARRRFAAAARRDVVERFSISTAARRLFEAWIGVAQTDARAYDHAHD